MSALKTSSAEVFNVLYLLGKLSQPKSVILGQHLSKNPRGAFRSFTGFFMYFEFFKVTLFYKEQRILGIYSQSQPFSQTGMGIQEFTKPSYHFCAEEKKARLE